MQVIWQPDCRDNARAEQRNEAARKETETESDTITGSKQENEGL